MVAAPEQTAYGVFAVPGFAAGKSACLAAASGRVPACKDPPSILDCGACMCSPDLRLSLWYQHK